ncbi:MAG: hypothetical protein R3D80_07200 [Paracoccaceae bacterium]
MTLPTDADFDTAEKLAPGQRAELVVASRDGRDKTVIYITDRRFEAPNWSPDGRWLIVNGGGKLYRIAADGSGGPVEIDTAPVEDINNDHVISPDGRWIFVSSEDGHIYRLPFAGGTPRRVSNDRPPAYAFRHYLHGISPDGTRLAYVGLELRAGRLMARIWTIPAAGGDDCLHAEGVTLVDGPDFAPEGDALWFNGEPPGAAPGHAQIFRKPLAGGDCVQMTDDERVNWFPHPSPDGTLVAYLSYPPGTQGHPADRDVLIRTMRPDGSDIRDIDRFTGGQGTINVPSWAPDSAAFAYVRYPVDG